MSLKGWVVNGVNRLFTREDLPPRATPLGRAAMRREGARNEPRLHVPGDDDALPRPEHLGAYAPLVAAMREELELFVASHVRMHLAIAERDRYLLRSIEVDCTGADDARELLQRFIREFKPEQIKHFLAKEVIGRLPNASAIDLAHFGGLNVPPGGDLVDADEAYGELLAELRRAEPRAGQRPYQVNLKGRWSEQDAAPAGTSARPRGFDIPRTPVAGRTVDVEIDDANGSRRVSLPSVVPGHRYAVGSGEGCDIVVSGKYTSRRHCEIWLDKGAWWVTDSGSTNGVRLESASGVLGRSGSTAGRAGAGQAVLEVVRGARIVLSALARGEPSDYPRLSLRIPGEVGALMTPMAPPARIPTTPGTPIVATRRRDSGMILTVRMASGERTVELPSEPLPYRVGRSRNQAFVIDWAHEDVSGHHLDIVEIGDADAEVAVHGDNGVTVAGISHPPGARFRWRLGETLVLGATGGRESECTLTLSRRA